MRCEPRAPVPRPQVSRGRRTARQNRRRRRGFRLGRATRPRPDGRERTRRPWSPVLRAQTTAPRAVGVRFRRAPLPIDDGSNPPLSSRATAQTHLSTSTAAGHARGPRSLRARHWARRGRGARPRRPRLAAGRMVVPRAQPRPPRPPNHPHRKPHRIRPRPRSAPMKSSPLPAGPSMRPRHPDAGQPCRRQATPQGRASHETQSRREQEPHRHVNVSGRLEFLSRSGRPLSRRPTRAPRARGRP